MSKRFNFKINTAIIIFLAFIFKIFFVNVELINSLNNPQVKKHFTSSFSGTDKKTSNTEVSNKENFELYSLVEVCEENSDNEENEFKAAPAVLLSFVYSLFKQTESSSLSNNPFDFVNYNLYPKRYLSLSILRI